MCAYPPSLSFNGKETSHKTIETSGGGLFLQIARFPKVGLGYSVLVEVMFTAIKINPIF